MLQLLSEYRRVKNSCAAYSEVQGQDELYIKLKKEATQKMERICKTFPDIKLYLVPLLEHWDSNAPPLGHGYMHALNTAYNVLNVLEEMDGKSHEDISRYAELLILAGFYHDVYRPIEVHENNGIVPNGYDSAEMTSSMLHELLPPHELDVLYRIIKHHDDPLRTREESLALNTMILRLADMQDVYPTRVLACVHEFNRIKDEKLSGDVILKKWLIKQDFDCKTMKEMYRFGLPAENTERVYEDVKQFLEEAIGSGELDLWIEESARIEKMQEEAARDVLLNFVNS